MTKLANISCKSFIYGVIPDPFLHLRSSKTAHMKGIDTLKSKCLAAIFLRMLVGDIWRKPLIDLTELAKISYKLFSFGVIPDPFLDLRSCKMEQMKGIDAMER